MDKTIRKNPDMEEEQNAVYRYWASVPIGERMLAIWEHSKLLYRMKGIDIDRTRPSRTITRFERPPR